MRGLRNMARAVRYRLSVLLWQLRQPYGGWRQRALRLIETTPLTIPVGLAVFGTIAMTFLVADSFKTWPVLLLGVPAALAAMLGAHHLAAGNPGRPSSRREQRLCDVLVVAGVLLWTIGNLPFTSQHIFTDRDPATYAVAGAWLINHDSVRIPAAAGFDNIAGVTNASLGFSPSTHDSSEIYAQGAHILPALLGLAGRFVGSEAMLHLNVVFGGTALLAVYSLARLFMRSRWALGATLTLSLTLPMIYFARDAYTEPLALTFIFGSLSLLWYAEHNRANASRGWLGWVAWPLAGLTLGAAVLARIDTYLPLAAVWGFLLLQLAVTPAGSRRKAIRHRLLFALPLAAVALLAWLDLTLLSSGYYRDLRSQFMSQLILLAAATTAGLTAVAIGWRSRLFSLGDRLTRNWRYPAGIAALTVFFAFLASRSLWQTNYAMKDGSAVRSYAEHSLVWMSWYLGPVLAILAVVGIVAIGAKIIQGKLLKTLPAMCALAVCLYYLVNPNISSDQIWAARRFLPVVLPGFTLVGFLLLAKLHERQPFRWRGIPVEPRQLAAGLAMLSLVGPLFVSFPFLATRTYAPQLAQVQYICDSIPTNAVVAWVGSAKHTSIQPTQAFCGVSSFGIVDDADLPRLLPELQSLAAASDRQLVIGVKAEEAGILPESTRSALNRQNSITYADLEQTYKKFPRNQALYNQSIVLGVISSNTALAKP